MRPFQTDVSKAGSKWKQAHAYLLYTIYSHPLSKIATLPWGGGYDDDDDDDDDDGGDGGDRLNFRMRIAMMNAV